MQSLLRSVENFPYPVRIGTDIIDIGRFKFNNQTSEQTSRFLQKIFTPREILNLMPAFVRPNLTIEPETHLRACETICGKWAAKEAVIKAVANRKLTYRQIEIWKDHQHKPFAVILPEEIVFTPRSYEIFSQTETPHLDPNILEQVGGLTYDTAGQISRLTISHEKEFAIAFALVADEDMQSTKSFSCGSVTAATTS